MRSFVRALVLGASVIAVGCAGGGANGQPPQQAQLTRAISPPRRLEPPAYLPAPARLALGTLMASHSRNLGELTSAIMVLDYRRIQATADAVASDASLSRPLSQDASEINAFLPEEFFRQQDLLRAQARLLVDAAADQNAYAVADAYGRLSESCVRCHHIYRAGSR